jgi:hypothetical protein
MGFSHFSRTSVHATYKSKFATCITRKTHFLSPGMFDMRALALIAVSAACADAFVAGPALLPSTRAVSACGAPTLRMAADNRNFDLSITRRGILNAGAATAAAWVSRQSIPKVCVCVCVERERERGERERERERERLTERGGICILCVRWTGRRMSWIGQLHA